MDVIWPLLMGLCQVSIVPEPTIKNGSLGNTSEFLSLKPANFETENKSKASTKLY